MSPAAPSSVNQLYRLLETSQKELGTLDITNINEALIKLSKLLGSSERIKEDKDVNKKQLLDLVNRLNQTVLAPITKTKQELGPSFSISESLWRNLCALFKALDAGIPEQRQHSGVRWWSKPSMSQVLVNANSNIDRALGDFQRSGTMLIDPSGRCDLKSSNKDEPSAQPKDQEVRVQAESGPSNASNGTLPPEVSLITKECPRFRILLLGKTGAGKSSLIEKIFGVDSVDIASFRAGKADINSEHTSPQNPYFVLHDSLGFEPGSLEQYAIVEKFIQERSQMPNLADRVHAVWLCAAAPPAGGRAFESGDEQIFKLQVGSVPLIVVFTQYDTLVTKRRFNAKRTNKNLTDAHVKAQAEQDFDKLCAQPLKEVCTKVQEGWTPPFTKVSKNKGYEDTLKDLVRLTWDLLPADARDGTPPNLGYSPRPGNSSSAHNTGSSPPQDHSMAGVALAIAQRVDTKTKIDAIIAIGRQRYWRGLASSLNFKGKTLDQCIKVIHEDIIHVWNFYDPEGYLKSEQFRKLMSTVVDSGETESRITNSSGRPDGGFPEMPGLTVGAAIGFSISLIVAFSRWVHESYKRSPRVVGHLMGHIVDTTLMTQDLFWVMRDKGGIQPITKPLVDDAVKDYYESNKRREMHHEIEKFVGEAGILEITNRDLVFDKVVMLISDYSYQPNVSG